MMRADIAADRAGSNMDDPEIAPAVFGLKPQASNIQYPMGPHSHAAGHLRLQKSGRACNAAFAWSATGNTVAHYTQKEADSMFKISHIRVCGQYYPFRLSKSRPVRQAICVPQAIHDRESTGRDAQPQNDTRTRFCDQRRLQHII
jgi:hypothetical protein